MVYHFPAIYSLLGGDSLVRINTQFVQQQKLKKCPLLAYAKICPQITHLKHGILAAKKNKNKAMRIPSK